MSRFITEFIKGTSLGKHIFEYTFFSYQSNEALHLSASEREVIMDCLENIKTELLRTIDKHSRKLIISNIELLLQYCLRFYDRQFITREAVNQGVVERFEGLINNYIFEGKLKTEGIPNVTYFSNEMQLSYNYFCDLIRKETGKSVLEFIHLKLLEVAKEKVLDTTKSISEISYELGFKYPQHFTRLFKQKLGLSPNEYRSLN